MHVRLSTPQTKTQCASSGGLACGGGAARYTCINPTQCCSLPEPNKLLLVHFAAPPERPPPLLLQGQRVRMCPVPARSMWASPSVLLLLASGQAPHLFAPLLRRMQRPWKAREWQPPAPPPPIAPLAPAGQHDVGLPCRPAREKNARMPSRTCASHSTWRVPLPSFPPSPTHSFTHSFIRLSCTHPSAYCCCPDPGHSHERKVLSQASCILICICMGQGM